LAAVPPNPASDAVIVSTPPELPLKAQHPALSRATSKAPATIAKPKAKPAKVSTDPFLKRH